MKIIKNWLFIDHLWHGPVVINLNNVTQITEEYDSNFGTHVVMHTNDQESIPVKGEPIEILALLQNYLSNN